MNINNLNQEKVEAYIQGQLNLEKWRNVPQRLLEYEKKESIIPLIDQYLEQSSPEQYKKDFENYSSFAPVIMLNPFKSLTAKCEKENYAKKIAYKAFNFLASHYNNLIVNIFFLVDNHSFDPFLCVMALTVLKEPERFHKKTEEHDCNEDRKNSIIQIGSIMKNNPKDIQECLKEELSNFILRHILDDGSENWLIKFVSNYYQKHLKIEYFNYLQKIEIIRQGLADAEHVEENDFDDYSKRDKLSDAYVILVNTLVISRKKRTVISSLDNDTKTLKNDLKYLLERYQALANMFKYLCNKASTQFEIAEEGNKYIENLYIHLN